ncbi:alpha/beta-hydrolase [Xylariaceae sp. FL0594]|nr:alpha/beta-hydrolase [Xylariaceae sp. FL0594]
MAEEHTIAKPSGECCLKGYIHGGEKARGTFETVSNIETYVSEPPAEKANGHVLFYFPDIWGMFNNGLLVMDAFADAGYRVFGIDYFRGDPVWKHRKDGDDESDLDFDFEAWKARHKAFADENLPLWIDEVKARHGRPDTRYACVGYCFGAPYVCDQLSASGGCDAGAFAHPAFLEDRHIRDLEKPLFLSCSYVDHCFETEERNRTVDILEQEGKAYHLQLFSRVEHGFALRGNMDDPYEPPETATCKADCPVPKTVGVAEPDICIVGRQT